MTIQVKNEKYVLSQEEKNQRNAIMYLKGCIVGYTIKKGGKHNSEKEPSAIFSKGVKDSGPKEWKNDWGTHIRKANDGWATVCHIIHNRLRHEKDHTGSYESDQKFLTDFSEGRYLNFRHVKELQEALQEYSVVIPGLSQ